MGCNEHEKSPMMYCQKCDIFVCDRCHMVQNPDHYHYLFLHKPNSSDILVKKENIRSIEENLEEKIQQAIGIHKRNTQGEQTIAPEPKAPSEEPKPQLEKTKPPIEAPKSPKVQAIKEKVVSSSADKVKPTEEKKEKKIPDAIVIRTKDTDEQGMEEYLPDMVDAITNMGLKEKKD